jgi:hypothetical protein
MMDAPTLALCIQVTAAARPEALSKELAAAPMA